jgi:hypothetical protein
LTFHGSCVVEWQNLLCVLVVCARGAFTAAVIALAAGSALAAALAFAALATFTALTAFFARGAFVAWLWGCFCCRFGCGCVVEGGLAFGVAIVTAVAVAFVAWTATFAVLDLAFAALCTFTACWAIATGFGTFCIALGAVTATTAATTTASAIGVAAIAALATFARLFVADGGLGFFVIRAAEQPGEPTPQAA